MKTETTKSMVILTASPKLFAPAEQFLRNRSWSVMATTDERDAMRWVLEKKPSFFLISVEHSNVKVRSLHRLLKQSCPDLCVVYFAENNNIETYRRMAQIDHTYRVQPPITGPAVERIVNRYLKDLRQAQIQQELFERSVRRSFPESQSITWATPKESGQELLSRGVVQVLESCLNVGDGRIKEPLTGETTQTACIAIESERFSGYLLTAMPGDRAFDQNFISLIRERLVKFLADNGEALREDDSFPMKVRRVQFESWATEYADFLKKSVHEGQEVAMAFFPMSEVSTLVGETNGAGMFRVRMPDLVADEKVDFNLYLFLPANQKHILYTPKDSVFFAHQKERLSTGNIVEMHVKSEELPAFKRYRARHRIEALIKEYEAQS